MKIYLYLNEQQVGPYTSEQIRQFLNNGQITWETPSRCEGQTDWVAVSAILSATPIRVNHAPVVIQSTRINLTYLKQNIAWVLLVLVGGCWIWDHMQLSRRNNEIAGECMESHMKNQKLAGLYRESTEMCEAERRKNKAIEFASGIKPKNPISLSTGILPSTVIPISSQVALTEQAEEMAIAFTTGDYERLVDYTYAPMVEAMGGKVSAVNLIRESMRQFKAKGIELKKVQLLNSSTIVRDVGKDIALIPANLKLEAQEIKGEISTYFVAVSDAGKSKWTFIDGTKFQKKDFETLFPIASRELILPVVRNSLMEELLGSVRDK